MNVQRRRDPARQMARFYATSLQLCLPLDGAVRVDLVREWGRIGSEGTVRVDRFATEADAHRERTRLERQKKRRGYQRKEDRCPSDSCT